MKKMDIIKFSILILAIFPVSCFSGDKLVLEKSDVQFFKAEEIINKKQRTLSISGLAFHSSLAVSDIKIVEKETTLSVLVFLTPARKGLSGSFSVEVPIPESVNDVKFGNEKIVIWQRK